MIVQRPPARHCVGALLCFALGLAASTALPLLTGNVDFSRAKLSIWPCLLLGGIATAIVLARGRSGSGWLAWWSAGLVAYAFHLAFTLGVLFAWSPGEVFADQGPWVAGANFGLLLLWLLSVVSNLLGRGWSLLDAAALGLFAIASLTSTLVFGSDGATYGGYLLLAAWLLALYLRISIPARS